MPWFGAVSLHKNVQRQREDLLAVYIPQSEPALVSPEDRCLILPSIKRASGIDTTFEVIRIVSPPVTVENIREATAKRVVFPSLNATAYAL